MASTSYCRQGGQDGTANGVRIDETASRCLGRCEYSWLDGAGQPTRAKLIGDHLRRFGQSVVSMQHGKRDFRQVNGRLFFVAGIVGDEKLSIVDEHSGVTCVSAAGQFHEFREHAVLGKESDDRRRAVVGVLAGPNELLTRCTCERSPDDW